MTLAAPCDMLEESGRVMAIDNDALWVETIQVSTCGSCRARAGCGQRVLAGLLHNGSHLRVLLGGRRSDEFRLGQEVTIGIPGDVVVASSLVLYLIPVVSLLAGAALLAHWEASDALVALGGMAGLVAGGALVRYLSWRVRYHPRLQPVLLDAPALKPENPILN